MSNRLKKLEHIVAGAKCDMKEDNQGVLQIIKWHDPRPQPTDAAIDAVSDQDADDSWNENKTKEGKFNLDIVRAMGLTVKDFMNEIMSGRTTPITNGELKTKYKSHL